MRPRPLPRRVRFASPTPRAETRRSPSVGRGEDDEILSLHPILQYDLDAVRWLVTHRETRSWLQGLVVATTSKIRTQDISLLLWLVFFVMVPELGLPYMWICIGNVFTVLLLQYLAQVLRPIDVDQTLPRLPVCIDPDTNGFPCVDSHMAIVVLVPIMENTSSHVAHIAFSLVGFYISATRVLLGTRFLSQIVGSWFTGLTGLIVGNHGHLVVKSYRLSSGANTIAIVIVLAILMVVVGQWVEHNESRIVGIPKTDFLDVLTNILHSDGASTASASTSRVHQFPTEEAGNHDDEDDEEQVVGKKDSFYYLMQSMRARARGSPAAAPTQWF